MNEIDERIKELNKQINDLYTQKRINFLKEEKIEFVLIEIHAKENAYTFEVKNKQELISLIEKIK